MKQLVKRNLLIYFRDKVSVFFSILAALITFILYILVFRNLYSNTNAGTFLGLTDIWAICGIVITPTVTASLGALWVWVDDKKNKLYQDFYVSPVKRWKLTGGYMLASFTIGIIMSMILLAATQIYLITQGVDLFSWQQYLQAFGVIVLSTFSGAGMMMFLVGLFSSSNAFSGFSLVIGTFMGFACGNYVPLGLMPEAAQTVIKFCPAAHASALLRQIFIGDKMAEMMNGAPEEIVNEFAIYMGINFSVNETIMEPWIHIAVLLGTGILFYALAIPVCSRKKMK